MTNKKLIENQLKQMGLKIGCYDPQIERLSKTQINKALDQAEYGSCDISIGNNVIEVFHVDSQVDFYLTEKDEYHLKYGRRCD